jgi:hypothetical protein
MMKQSVKPILCMAIALIFSALVNAQGSRTKQNSAPRVTISLNEHFFNSLLEVIFNDFKVPAYPLSLTDSGQANAAPKTDAAHSRLQCQSEVTVVREVAGAKTSVILSEGQILAPLAFTGNYKPPLGCVRFQGWAETHLLLDFNQEKQTLNLRVAVKKVRLEKVPDLLARPLAKLVQNSLDEKINPVPLLTAGQLAAHIPLAPLGGNMQLRAREIKPEIRQGQLDLHIEYEFTRAK